MNELLSNRLQAIQESLVAVHRGGSGLPSAMIGSEREHFLNGYLAQLLPPLYRFGRGAITDSRGNLCGQLDVVMELPLAPSFPMQGGYARLYLAESVAAVIEVKSNLTAQWAQVEKTTQRVRELTRNLRQRFSLLLESSFTPQFEVDEHIPCYAVGYTGYKTLAGLERRLESTSPKSRPDGVLVIDSGCFVGSLRQTRGEWGLYALVEELVENVNAVLQIAYPPLSSYLVDGEALGDQNS